MSKRAVLSLAVLICLTSTARAEGPQLPDYVRNPPPRTFETSLVLTPGAKDDPQMYVRLPAEMMKRTHADARTGQSSTLIAGVALALAFTLAGLWLVRGGRRRLLGGAALTLAVVLVAGLTGCPPRSPLGDFRIYDEQLDRPTCAADGSLRGEALLQVEDERSSIQVVVPREQLAEFTCSQGEE